MPITDCYENLKSALINRPFRLIIVDLEIVDLEIVLLLILVCHPPQPLQWISKLRQVSHLQLRYMSYPERLTVVLEYIFILVPRGNQTYNPGVASTMLYQLSHTRPHTYLTFDN